EIGYPVIVKASAGGGGRGMRVAHNEMALRSAIGAASQEAAAAFGNGAVYVEKFLENARHIEIQVLGDKHGNAVHLFDRDCTTQRRHQKLVEEAPAPGVDARKREAVARSAADLIRRAEYAGAATVEFLMDEEQNFYMLEVNTRVQVEHPVTEMITGIDIVKAMIRIAAGEPLPWKQRDIALSGHAVECRINAEDPDRGFIPQPGLITEFTPPGGLGIRLDTHVRTGYRIPPDYDSLIGKLIVHGRDRAQAISKTQAALEEFRIGPIKTTIPLHRRLMAERQFLDAKHDIHYVERLLRMDNPGPGEVRAYPDCELSRGPQARQWFERTPTASSAAGRRPGNGSSVPRLRAQPRAAGPTAGARNSATYFLGSMVRLHETTGMSPTLKAASLTPSVTWNSSRIRWFPEVGTCGSAPTLTPSVGSSLIAMPSGLWWM
ncbi:MAG: ATP-binding protein, partial [Planctomycetota bacterium]